MNVGIDISIEKLSTPLERLNLERRACRGMRRASFYSVAEIVLAGKPKLCSVKNMGLVTVNRILEAVAAYLGIPEDELASESLPKPGSFSDPWVAPIRVLPLPASTLQWLESASLFQIDDLVKARATDYDKLMGLRGKPVYEIDRALTWYLARAAQIQLLSIVGADAILEPVAPGPQPIPEMSLTLRSQGLNERAMTYSITKGFLSWSDRGPMP